MTDKLITIKNCNIENNKSVLLKNISWQMKSGEAWLIIGANGSGKADFLKAVAGADGIRVSPVASGTDSSFYSNVFRESVELVSLEVAARIIQEEREKDESEYLEGGVDNGRTGRDFLSEVMAASYAGGTCTEISSLPAVKLCGIGNVLDRGLKYMSTGEIRRTLLARALISEKELLILSDPFAGLDTGSRNILSGFFSSVSERQKPHLILSMERWHEIPDSITNVLEFKDMEISYCGSRSEYEKLLIKRKEVNKDSYNADKMAFSEALSKTISDTKILYKDNMSVSENSPIGNIDLGCEKLIEMHNVNVGWDGNSVLKNLSWTVHKGEHWLVRGPNGSGKTTLLELITGDNMQVFCNDIKIFGSHRGSGESIWDIKRKLGIVSYRLHVEYRMLGGTSLQNVIISGFRDSIGLYGAATDMEIAGARKWLKLGGFENRENINFGDLSYGEQRAVLILRSAVKCPELLILDEPCHGLDENYRSRILQLMEKIGEEGSTTMLHVTHDPSEVLECEKHILELRPGEEPMYRIIMP